MPVHIHHFVISCKNPKDTCQQFCRKFAFRQFAICNVEGKGVKIAAKITDEIVIVFEQRLTSARRDTVYDVALAMDNLSDRYTQAVNNGADFIQPLTRIKDQNGYVDYAIVKVPVGNIQHTLLDMSHYHGQFLPGYQPIAQNGPVDTDHRLTSIDHVTCVCHQNTTVPLLQWYQKCFNFTRFTINADEEDDGYRLNDLHIKMIAAQYWLCAEQGIQSLNGHFKFVLAEPLDITGNYLPLEWGCNVYFITAH